MNKTINKNSNNSYRQSLYWKADDAIMKGINKIVRAWNWTTGRTKADLANTMATMGFAGLTVGFSSYYPQVLGALAGMGGVIVVLSKTNKKIEKEEIDAIKNGVLSLEVENMKELFRIGGLFHGSMYGLYTGISATTGSMPAALGLGVMTVFLAPSYWVMRADCVPPRKNALVRGFEEAKNWLRRGMPQPVPVPVPVRK